MTEHLWLQALQQQRAIAVIRAPSFQAGASMAQAVAAGGFEQIEITWNSAAAPKLIAHLRATLPQCFIGSGTLLSGDDMKQAIAAGAQFLFSPHTQPDLIHIAVNAGIPIVAGALSPTEIVTAWQAGATCVKVFPVQAVGGAAYIRSLQGPLSQIPLIPTGGVTLENAKRFLEAGAVAVGLSGDLFPQAAIATEDWQAVTARSQALVDQLRA